MTPAPRRKPAPGSPGLVRLADASDPPLDPRPAAGPRGRTSPAGIEPMFTVRDLAELLRTTRRTVERLRSAGKVPRPDMHVGRCPRWMPATIRAWIERGGK